MRDLWVLPVSALEEVAGGADTGLEEEAAVHCCCWRVVALLLYRSDVGVGSA